MPVVQGNLAEAKILYQRRLTIQEKALSPEHHDVAISLNDLAGLMYNQVFASFARVAVGSV